MLDKISNLTILAQEALDEALDIVAQSEFANVLPEEIERKRFAAFDAIDDLAKYARRIALEIPVD